MIRIKNKFKELKHKKQKAFGVFLTAGYPSIEYSKNIFKKILDAKVDFIEIGLPFSDPMADGPLIQHSSQIAIEQNISVEESFNLVKEIRKINNDIPIILMGYYNPIHYYGNLKFIKKAVLSGIDGLIIPDLPIDYYEANYKSIFEENRLYNMFLIAPQTLDERIQKIDSISNGFIYMVSSSSITGSKNSFSPEQINYFERIEKMNLKTPRIIGFGVGNKQTFNTVVKYSKGAIIGSAFIKNLHENGIDSIASYIGSIR